MSETTASKSLRPPDDPYGTLLAWYNAAREAGVPSYDSPSLATADADGRPSSRTVIIRYIDDRGLTFFTNYQSRKAREISANDRVALLFWWHPLGRQIRVEGRAEKIPVAESDEYFDTRSRGSQLAAWASDQSRAISGRNVLDRRLTELSAQFPSEVARPPHWGGFRVIPDLIEFWQSGADRLHDRFCCRLTGGRWITERLAP